MPSCFRPVRSFPALIVPLLLGACADRSVAPTLPNDPPAIDSVTLAQFAGSGNGLVQDLLHSVYGGQQFATPNPFILPPVSVAPAGLPALRGAPAASAAACVPTLTGVDTAGHAIDSDADGTPDDFTVDYGAGCSQPSGGEIITFAGSYRQQEAAGSVAGFGFSTDHLSAQARDTATGHFVRQEVNGSETGHFAATSATHQMDVTLAVGSWSGGDSSAVILRTLATSGYVPDGGATFQLHGSLPQGTFHLDGALIFTDLHAGPDSLRMVLSTPTPLHASFDCVTGIDAGVFQGLLEGDPRVGFRLTWNGCGSPVVEEFGATP